MSLRSHSDDVNAPAPARSPLLASRFTSSRVLTIQTPSGRWEALADRILGFLRADVIALACDGVPVRGFRSPDSPALWIRDHSDILRGGVYVEADVWSAVDAFARSQSANGRVFDFVTTKPTPQNRENWETWVRVPVEADVEYRFVKAAYLAWQASGDDARLQAILPALQRALTYTRTHADRWDDTHGLVKRPYTIDTWDFDYTAGRVPWLNFQITEATFWGLSHADNSGFFEAAALLSALYAHMGTRHLAAYWRTEAAELRERANTALWNGRFYTHFHPIVLVEVDGQSVEAPHADERLSLSNPMAVNRGLATHAMAEAILDEYARRGAEGRAFAPWWSVDPPFPDGFFGDEKLVGGAYVNGGILPLVGGELALAAFEHGREAFGVDTLAVYAELVARTGETYLWYAPDGSPSTVDTSTSPEATPTDGWGASAMLYALTRGLAGVRDEGHSFGSVRLAPRWMATGEDEAAVRLAYEASGAGFAYTYRHDPAARTVRLTLEGHADVALSLLLPEGARATALVWNGALAPVTAATVGASAYARGTGRVDGHATVEVGYA